MPRATRRSRARKGLPSSSSCLRQFLQVSVSNEETTEQLEALAAAATVAAGGKGAPKCDYDGDLEEGEGMDGRKDSHPANGTRSTRAPRRAPTHTWTSLLLSSPLPTYLLSPPPSEWRWKRVCASVSGGGVPFFLVALKSEMTISFPLQPAHYACSIRGIEISPITSAFLNARSSLPFASFLCPAFFCDPGPFLLMRASGDELFFARYAMPVLPRDVCKHWRSHSCNTGSYGASLLLHLLSTLSFEDLLLKSLVHSHDALRESHSSLGMRCISLSA